MGEPEAKQYVLDSIDRCRGALSATDSADNPDLCNHRKTIEEVLELIESLKEKVFLKTKKAVTPAYLVLESSQNIAELAEDLDADDEDAVGEFGEAADHLKDNAAKLKGASKQHSVIVT